METQSTHFFKKLTGEKQKSPATFRLRRLSFIRSVTFFIFFILITRAVYLQLWTDKFYNSMKNQRQAVVTKRAQRGLILDRNGQVLANNIKTYRIATDPSKLKEKDISRMLSELPKVFPKIKLDVLKRRLTNKRRRDVLIWRHAMKEEVDAVRAVIPRHIYTQPMTRRVYPKKELAGPLIGFVRVVEDPNRPGGRSGVEQAYDWLLQGNDIKIGSERDGRKRVFSVNGSSPQVTSIGQSIKLTIDMRIQQLAEAYLKDQVTEMEAKSGVVVVMDPHTGDLLALAQVPTYDPNEYNEYPIMSYQNYAVSHPIEPGSTIKPFLVAAALNENLLRPDSRFSGHDGRFRLGEHWIRDSHPAKELSTLEVIKYSSNIGAIQIAQLLGKKAYYSYLKSFGFGDLTHVGLNHESRGRLRSVSEWGQVHLGTFSYGYGFSATPLQITQALCVIANGGRLVTPRLVKSILNADGEVIDRVPVQMKRRVIRKSVADAVTRGLVMVTEAKGTGVRARVDGYIVAGKTGTARKIASGKKGYSSERVSASFMGFVPAHAPRLAIYINIDEPQTEHYGGKVAAPVFSRIAAEALPFLGVPATEQQGPNRRERALLRNPQRRSKVSVDNQPWWSKDRFLTNAPNDLIIPELKGKDLSTALRELVDYQLDVRVSGSGVVIDQSPASGELLPSDRKIYLTLERPPVLTRVPTGAPLNPLQPKGAHSTTRPSIRPPSKMAAP